VTLPTVSVGNRTFDPDTAPLSNRYQSAGWAAKRRRPGVQHEPLGGAAVAARCG